MRRTAKLSRFLPLQFSNGHKVKQFSKPCLRCKHMLHANDMHGIARLIQDQIHLAADAECPACGLKFGVACVIDSEKRVKRVLPPPWLFLLLLRVIPGTDPGPHPLLPDTSTMPAGPIQPQNYRRATEVIGRYADREIPAYIEINGQRYDFDRIEPKGTGDVSEFLIDGCLVYRS
ncbi:hypothetical protein [Parachitinimonas caeni]|uniref:Uncharacterized protein n=1 Tax=Parachitinimonas caeni TaxID=3031301 RepID=A0ABT7DRE6_9NEIS|nr:hypothetical protein [Parachitinimonas caeni]MDK2122549.1 hypothetical protein [Parachitinimonas caeni]